MIVYLEYHTHGSNQNHKDFRSLRGTRQPVLISDKQLPNPHHKFEFAKYLNHQDEDLPKNGNFIRMTVIRLLDCTIDYCLHTVCQKYVNGFIEKERVTVKIQNNPSSPQSEKEGSIGNHKMEELSKASSCIKTGLTFFQAVKVAHYEKVLEHLQGNIDINASNSKGLNALHIASKNGHVTIVQELVKRGADVNALTKKGGKTALHLAALSGKEDVAKILIQNGADVEAQSLTGFTALLMAAEKVNVGVFNVLLSNGARQNYSQGEKSLINIALKPGRGKILTLLLQMPIMQCQTIHSSLKEKYCEAAAVVGEKKGFQLDEASKGLKTAAVFGNGIDMTATQNTKESKCEKEELNGSFQNIHLDDEDISEDNKDLYKELEKDGWTIID